MKKGTPLFAICFSIFFVVVTILRDNKDYKYLKLLQNEAVISDIKVTGIYNSMGDRVNITITNKGILDSINNELINNLKPSDEVCIMGVQITCVIFEITKGNNKFDVQVGNSKYNGRLIEVGGVCYTNDYIFRLVQIYEGNYKDKEVQ